MLVYGDARAAVDDDARQAARRSASTACASRSSGRSSRPAERRQAEAGLRRDRPGRVPAPALGALRPRRPRARWRAGSRVNFNLTVAGPALGDRRRAGARRTSHDDVRARTPRSSASSSQAVGKRYSGTYHGPAARRLLVDLERAQPGRLADAAVGARPAQRRRAGRGARRALPRARRRARGTALRDTGHGTRHDPHRRDRAEGPAATAGRHALDRRAALHPPRCTASTTTSSSLQGRRGRGPRLPGRRPGARSSPQNPGAVPRHRLRAPPLRAAVAARPARPRRPDWVTMANLGDLSRELRAHLRALRPEDAGARGVPLYLTEFGYQTNPPDPIRRLAAPSRPRTSTRPSTSPARNPQRAHARPVPARRRRADPSSRQDAAAPGVAHVPDRAALLDGKRKPAYAAYQHADLSSSAARAPRRAGCGVFGMLRPRRARRPRRAVSGAVARARRASAGATRKTVARRRTAPLLRHDASACRRSGVVRLRWATAGASARSRAARAQRAARCSGRRQRPRRRARPAARPGPPRLRGR